jgi:hypothetical protein
MKFGHREAQDLFLEIGEALGFAVRRSFSSPDPSDGVWLLGPRYGVHTGLPAVALEVVVSENAKSVEGSIHRLESISPCLGVVLLQEEEIGRRLIRVSPAGTSMLPSPATSKGLTDTSAARSSASSGGATPNSPGCTG